MHSYSGSTSSRSTSATPSAPPSTRRREQGEMVARPPSAPCREEQLPRFALHPQWGGRSMSISRRSSGSHFPSQRATTNSVCAKALFFMSRPIPLKPSRLLRYALAPGQRHNAFISQELIWRRVTSSLGEFRSATCRPGQTSSRDPIRGRGARPKPDTRTAAGGRPLTPKNTRACQPWKRNPNGFNNFRKIGARGAAAANRTAVRLWRCVWPTPPRRTTPHHAGNRGARPLSTAATSFTTQLMLSMAVIVRLARCGARYAFGTSSRG